MGEAEQERADLVAALSWDLLAAIGRPRGGDYEYLLWSWSAGWLR